MYQDRCGTGQFVTTNSQIARLLGVSGVTLYKWEGGEVRPRRAQLEAIAAVRGIGKRVALARLEQQG